MAKGATVDVPMHWAYLMGIWRNVPMSHDEKKKRCIRFAIMLILGASKHQKVYDRWKALENIFHLRRCRTF